MFESVLVVFCGCLRYFVIVSYTFGEFGLCLGVFCLKIVCV